MIAVRGAIIEKILFTKAAEVRKSDKKIAREGKHGNTGNSIPGHY